MRRDWTLVNLGDVAILNPRRPLARNTIAPHLSMALVTENRRDIEEFHYREFKGSGMRFRNFDTLLARITPCLENGKTAFVHGLQSDEIAHGSTEFIVIAAKEGTTSSLYLYYLARSENLRTFAINRMEGTSGRQRVSATAISSFEFPLPPLPIQKRIAHVLGTLDDKIELNRKMNQTLEAMAQAIFKSWFVDFDPVHAKAEGRDTGLPPEIDALFPDSFVESELGLIPEGWEVKRTEEIIKRESVGKRYSKKTSLLFGKIPILDQSANGIIGFHNDDPGVNATSDSPIAIFTNHTCNMRLVNFPFSAIQNVIPFTGLNVSTTWAYYATYGRQKFIEYKGHWPDFIVHRVVVPSTSLTREYAAFVQPLSERLWFNQNRATTLAALRDTLLPKLLSGEVSVEDVEMEDVEMEDVEMEDVEMEDVEMEDVG